MVYYYAIRYELDFLCQISLGCMQIVLQFSWTEILYTVMIDSCDNCVTLFYFVSCFIKQSKAKQLLCCDDLNSTIVLLSLTTITFH